MELNTDRLPSVNKTAFICPSCNAYAHQGWLVLIPAWVASVAAAKKLPLIGEQAPRKWSPTVMALEGRPVIVFPDIQPKGNGLVYNLNVSLCPHCGEIAVWVADKLVYPNSGLAPSPNPDLPDNIKRDYEEAGAILNLSPRGAAALLRLCIQKLCMYLGQPGKNLDADIGALVKKGLPVQVQQALDIVRLIGNQAIHPGTLDLRDDTHTAGTLFRLVNLIADAMITQPRNVDKMYKALPDEKRKHIDERDKDPV